MSTRPRMNRGESRATGDVSISPGTLTMTDSLERAFDLAMMDLYRRANVEASYNATRYRRMLEEHRGLGTARIILYALNVSEGYTALWERGRLDLTVEALTLQPKWRPLFSERERDIARGRLAAYNYAFSEPAVARRSA
jgi:hypothetical protein